MPEPQVTGMPVAQGTGMPVLLSSGMPVPTTIGKLLALNDISKNESINEYDILADF